MIVVINLSMLPMYSAHDRLRRAKVDACSIGESARSAPVGQHISIAVSLFCKGR
jgi:hypothetical protein